MGGTVRRTAFTIVEVLVVVATIALLLGVLLPSIGKARDRARVNVSATNLHQMAVAHLAYASDWADRHVTFVPDSLGRHGGRVDLYTQAIYGSGGYPLLVAGRGYTAAGDYKVWAYWPGQGRFFQPINFPGLPYPKPVDVDGWGWFRFGMQLKPMSEYLGGRFHDPVFFAPKDRMLLDRIEPCFERPGEFIATPAECNPAWSSYSLSPAGLFDPQTFSDDGTGMFWNPPWERPGGYRVPTFSQVRYPGLKTHMLEHPWLQNVAVTCNGAFEGCEPYYFNHSFRSSPVVLFYDGSVRLMSVYEAMSSDRRHVRQAGHGLWSRDTPFGSDGYFIADGFDFAETSFHILTTDGVRGRDTVGAE